MTLLFLILLAYCLIPLAVGALDYVAPVGFEDENGFHLGIEVRYDQMLIFHGIQPK